MQLTAIEQTIVKHIHGLSFKEQQSLLDFILFLKGNIQHKENLQNKPLEEKPSPFLVAFNKFLKENQEDPLDIDTSIFDRDRAFVKDREIDL